MSDVVNIGSEPFDENADSIQDAFDNINQAFEKVEEDIDEKVDKVAGKGLSTDDFQADGDYEHLRARATTKDDVGLGVVENYPVASLAIAKAGTANDKYMTPLRTADHLNKRMAYGTAEPTGGDDGDIYFQYD